MAVRLELGGVAVRINTPRQALAVARDDLRRLRQALSRGWDAFVRTLPETLFVLALLAGWALLTWGVAAIATWKVWPVSGGLFFLSCCGWKVLGTLARDGLYALSKER